MGLEERKEKQMSQMIQGFTGTCPKCEESEDRSVVSYSAFLPVLERETPLMWIGETTGRLHLHDVVITDTRILTVRGFIKYKTRRLRWRLWGRYLPKNRGHGHG